ncbi:MAG: hypothetical protein HAW59_01770 [Betaproteobacteria bacterium]|nr:hypothetical protein [Betaproteobacteria bacterium]
MEKSCMELLYVFKNHAQPVNHKQQILPAKNGRRAVLRLPGVVWWGVLAGAETMKYF